MHGLVPQPHGVQMNLAADPEIRTTLLLAHGTHHGPCESRVGRFKNGTHERLREWPELHAMQEDK